VWLVTTVHATWHKGEEDSMETLAPALHMDRELHVGEGLAGIHQGFLFELMR
jgi:hypothetical protein